MEKKLKPNKWVTFDCYDTLVDYTNSKRTALSRIMAPKGIVAEKFKKSFDAFEAHEKELQNGPFIPLSEVIIESLKFASKSVGVNISIDEILTIINSIKKAQAFPDVFPALNKLKKDYKLAILSNSEPSIIKHNISTIGVEFNAVVLATDANCYKPNPRIFKKLIERIDEPANNITHVAQSFYHDIKQAKSLNFGKIIWVNRFNQKEHNDSKPHTQIKDLSTLVNVLK